MSAAVSTATTPGAAAHGIEIDVLEQAARDRRTADGEMQRSLGLANIVDIDRGAADVPHSGIVLRWRSRRSAARYRL